MRLRLLTIFVTAALFAAKAKADAIFVSSDFNHEVLSYDADTGNFLDTLIPAASGGLDQPHGILDRGDDLLVCSFGTNQILRYDRATGAFLSVFAGPASNLANPVYIVVGPDGNYYVASQGNDRILRYSPDGVLVDQFVPAGSGGLDGPSGIAFGPDGRLYVASRYSAQIIAYDGMTGTFDEVIADSTDGLTSGDTFGVAFDDGGDLYFASNGRVYRYNFSISSIVASPTTGFPIGIERGPDGAVYVATSNNIRRYNSGNNTLSAPLLSGGAINLLNFFHFASGHCVLCRGDYDLSGRVDEGDISPFVARLLENDGPACADLNGDGFEDGLDLQAFTEALLNAVCGN